MHVRETLTRMRSPLGHLEAEQRIGKKRIQAVHASLRYGYRATRHNHVWELGI